MTDKQQGSLKPTLTIMCNLINLIEARTANSTFAIGGVSCSVDSLVVAKSFVLRKNISGKYPAHRKSANRYSQCLNRP